MPPKFSASDHPELRYGVDHLFDPKIGVNRFLNLLTTYFLGAKFLIYGKMCLYTYTNTYTYLDDGLMLVRGSKRELDRICKKIKQLFATFGLKITTETGMKTTDFLHVTLIWMRAPSNYSEKMNNF